MFGIYSCLFRLRRPKPNNEQRRSTKKIDVDVEHAVDMARSIIAMVAQYSAGQISWVHVPGASCVSTARVA
jgi:hypothetical protein